jgi:hypothetical protein
MSAPELTLLFCGSHIIDNFIAQNQEAEVNFTLLASACDSHEFCLYAFSSMHSSTTEFNKYMVKDRDLTNMFAQLFSESKLSLAIAKDEMLEDFYENKEAFLAAYKESLRELILNPPRKVFAHSTVNESELIAGSKYTLFCDEANRWFWLSDDLNLYSTNKGKFQLI